MYVVASDSVVKFGVTASLKTRMEAHTRDGLTRVIRLVEGLPEGAAKWTEDQLITVLREAGAEPLGTSREYFDISWCPLVVGSFDRLTP